MKIHAALSQIATQKPRARCIARKAHRQGEQVSSEEELQSRSSASWFKATGKRQAQPNAIASIAVLITVGNPLQDQFKIDEWSFAIRNAADFTKASLSVERPSPSISVKSVEAYSVSVRGSGLFHGLADEHPANSAVLHGGKKCHIREIERFFHGGKVGDIDGPGFLSGQVERSNDLVVNPCYDNAGVPHSE
jgi:hypothetical protein